MAEAAGHPDPVRPDETAVEVVGGIGVVALRVPAPPRGLVEVWVWEEAQAEDAARLAVEGADRHRPAARANRHARVALQVLEGIGRAVGPAAVEPEAKALPVRPGRA